MFQTACNIVKEFTLPIVISKLAVGGDCSSSIGAFIIVNKEGWFVTAFHILKHWDELIEERKKTKDQNTAIKVIQDDKSLTPQQKKKATRKLLKPHRNQTKECSIWFGKNGWELEGWGGIEAIDLGLGKIKNFDPSLIKTYPTFKNPKKDLPLGTSLCRLGFPFYRITPTFDSKKGFELPPGTIPIPRFYNEGILCRIAELQFDGADQPLFPLNWIETTSPGLKGQSGGPIFDKNGVVWGIQCNTFSYPLDFNGKIPNTKIEVPQFLNVGRGVHVETIIGTLNEGKINISMSDY